MAVWGGSTRQLADALAPLAEANMLCLQRKCLEGVQELARQTYRFLHEGQWHPNARGVVQVQYPLSVKTPHVKGRVGWPGRCHVAAQRQQRNNTKNKHPKNIGAQRGNAARTEREGMLSRVPSLSRCAGEQSPKLSFATETALPNNQ